ncbi:MAG: type II toxin-antitoxin system VapC family toxin [Methylobacteriaceae bacterium]|nr:type II toxin-antitoxin system VapC family toxin [Methylobacteriaceae bacterium]
MICLDTNIVIAAINLRPAEVRVRLNDDLAAGVQIGIPAIVLFEMYYGARKSDRRAKSEAALRAFLGLAVTPLPFEIEDARHAGDIRAHLESHGSPIGYYDYLIAAQARSRGATLVTSNRREFERVPGLIVTDWSS